MIPEILIPIKKELDAAIAYVPSGSYFICGVTTTDIDVILLVAEDITLFLDDSWDMTIAYGNSKFMSARRGKYNLLITNDALYFKQMRIATELAIRFKLTNKQDRVDLFQAIKGEL